MFNTPTNHVARGGAYGDAFLSSLLSRSMIFPDLRKALEGQMKLFFWIFLEFFGIFEK